MLGQATYIVFEVVWAVPVLAVQWAVGWRRLRRHLGALAFALVTMTAYLTAADGVAIHAGIWTIRSSRVVGLRVLGVPLEEAIFFLLSNAMVVQTVILLWPSATPLRVWRQTLNKSDANSLHS